MPLPRVVLRASVQCALPTKRWSFGNAITGKSALDWSFCRQYGSTTRLFAPFVKANANEDTSRKTGRSPAVKASLRRVAQEAQQVRRHLQRQQGQEKISAQDASKREVTAYCAAEAYDIAKVTRILQDAGYQLDPFGTNLSPHVVHFQYPPIDVAKPHERQQGDVFVLPSGTVVAWNVADEYVRQLVTKSLVAAADGSHADRLEMEDLDYYEDAGSETSQMTGDTIVLGTRAAASPPTTTDGEHETPTQRQAEQTRQKQHQTNLVLGKIAFSSGLARSTKVAVLESQLERYFESTRDIPSVLMSKPKLPYTRQFILRKTGQLLSMRAQLNLSSELTDALPDLFWDSRYELGLEGYFVQVSRALDVGVRIRALNEKMNYAQEIASVLQDRLSEKHGLLLEWLIIALISIEVGFEILRLVRENVEHKDHDSIESLLKRYLEHAERERTS